MELTIIQNEEDKTNWLQKVCRFLQERKLRSETLESRFDVLVTEFAMQNHGQYDAKEKTLQIF